MRKLILLPDIRSKNPHSPITATAWEKLDPSPAYSEAAVCISLAPKLGYICATYSGIWTVSTVLGSTHIAPSNELVTE